jgi:hypothetical protein
VPSNGRALSTVAGIRTAMSSCLPAIIVLQGDGNRLRSWSGSWSC